MYPQVKEEQLKGIDVSLVPADELEEQFKRHFSSALDKARKGESIEKNAGFIAYSGSELLLDFTQTDLYWSELKSCLQRLLVGKNDCIVPPKTVIKKKNIKKARKP